MPRKPGHQGAAEITQARRRRRASQYVLKLYVAGITPKSTLAIQNLTFWCEKHLQGGYGLEIVDIYQQPELAKADQITVAPTLVKKSPLPLRRLVGSLADEHYVLAGLDLAPNESPRRGDMENLRQPPRETSLL